MRECWQAAAIFDGAAAWLEPEAVVSGFVRATVHGVVRNRLPTGNVGASAQVPA